MHLAYVISAYKYPGQLARVVLRLNQGEASFFVHMDRRSPYNAYGQMVDLLGGLSNVHFLSRHTCYWGGFGHVRATIKGIDEIMKTATPFDYVILLSGQDYPLKPMAEIEEFFRRAGDRCFIDAFPLPSDNWEYDGLDRIERWHVRTFGRYFAFPLKRDALGHGRLLRWLTLPARVPVRRRFPKGLRPYGGSSYWCLSRPCVMYIHDFLRRNPSFVRFFEFVDVPDEIFFQTIVMNSPLRQSVVNDDLRYVDWQDPDSASPAVLRKVDFAKLASSGKLFARKFDVTMDAEILDLIDKSLLGVSVPRHHPAFLARRGGL